MLFNFNWIGHGQPLVLIAGPCAIESWDICAAVAEELAEIASRLEIVTVFKSSFDKANRTSLGSFRGPGMHKGLMIIERIGKEFELPTITDVHEVDQIMPVSQAVDILQTPAFLVRQTDFIQAVASVHKPVNIKKGQWLAPEDMQHVVDKAKATGNDKIMLCERGTFFGYGNLVVDFRGLQTMRRTGCPVIFDATHSIQRPGGLGDRSGGDREFAPILARAAVAAGVDGIFAETHPDPDAAWSDGPNMIPLDELSAMVAKLKRIDIEARRK
jgi:2-dehydro-3-deoxyphosphooctonate aldolase (KDO 8-P synthase)